MEEEGKDMKEGEQMSEEGEWMEEEGWGMKEQKWIESRAILSFSSLLGEGVVWGSQWSSRHNLEIFPIGEDKKIDYFS